MIPMMIEPADASDDTGQDAAEDEEKTLRTRVPIEYRDLLHRRKEETGDLIQEMVQEALASYLDIPDEDPSDASGGHGTAAR